MHAYRRSNRSSKKMRANEQINASKPARIDASRCTELQQYRLVNSEELVDIKNKIK